MISQILFALLNMAKNLSSVFNPLKIWGAMGNDRGINMLVNYNLVGVEEKKRNFTFFTSSKPHDNTEVFEIR